MEKVAIVTGSNQGLGLALVGGLCRVLGPEAVVYLTARDAARGRAAQEAPARDKLSPEFLLQDVTDDASGKVPGPCSTPIALCIEAGALDRSTVSEALEAPIAA